MAKDVTGNMARRSAATALPAEYAKVLSQLKAEVRSARLRAQRVVNTELLRLYWTIGRTILDQQASQGWGAKVIDRLAEDLRAEFPDMTGLSRSNLKYMRRFAAAWPGGPIGQQPVAQLPWGHVTVLLGKPDDHATRDWYAAAAAEHGWSRNVLSHQIANRTHERSGAAPSNFAATLPAPDSDLAQAMSKDPYVFDFLGLTEKVAERELEQALMDRIQHVLSEFGRGFAFVGRQVHLDVDGDDFYIDLLFFHIEQLRYVVVELKVEDFKPEFAGKLNFYIAAVDDLYRRPQHAETVGILLCAGRNERVVQYSLMGQTAPMAVSTYTYETLPAAERALLPAAADIIEAVEQPIDLGWRQLTFDEYLEELERTTSATEATKDTGATADPGGSTAQ